MALMLLIYFVVLAEAVPVSAWLVLTLSVQWTSMKQLRERTP